MGGKFFFKVLVGCIETMHPRRNIFGRIYISFSLVSVCGGRKRSQWCTMPGLLRFLREESCRQAGWLAIFPYPSSPVMLSPATGSLQMCWEKSSQPVPASACGMGCVNFVLQMGPWSHRRLGPPAGAWRAAQGTRENLKAPSSLALQSGPPRCLGAPAL